MRLGFRVGAQLEVPSKPKQCQLRLLLGTVMLDPLTPLPAPPGAGSSGPPPEPSSHKKSKQWKWERQSRNQATTPDGSEGVSCITPGWSCHHAFERWQISPEMIQLRGSKLSKSTCTCRGGSSTCPRNT